ncbi:MAG TPA: helix-hairpin-helix domain-containing protein [Terracidiphilus sp.]|nr:helix-hairpin-helix domain-containing protein [Terracidiphilus sp.]
MPTGRIPLALAVALLLAIPHAGALPAHASATPAARTDTVPERDRVDINHATLEQLLAVPGMTRSWAGRIVRFRPYRAKSDLLKRGVVSSEVYERIKDTIVAHRKAQ